MDSNVLVNDIRRGNENNVHGYLILVETDSQGIFLYLDTGYRIRILNSAMNKILSQEVLERLTGNAIPATK